MIRASRQFELLLHDYDQVRENERATGTAFTSLLTAVIALLGLFGFALIHQADDRPPPPWMYTLLPVLPLPLMGLAAMLWVESGVRRRYLRACELELHKWVRPFAIDGAPVPSLHRLGMGGWWMKRRVVLAGMVFAALLVLYVAATFDAFLVVWRSGSCLAWVFTAYAAALIIVMAAYAEGVFAERAWFAALRSLRP